MSIDFRNVTQRTFLQGIKFNATFYRDNLDIDRTGVRRFYTGEVKYAACLALSCLAVQEMDISHVLNDIDYYNLYILTMYQEPAAL